MKPTLNINLNGMVYHIDDDAYGLLQDYLQAVESRLGDSDDTKEIMLDIEARIAELFSDMLFRQHTEVVTIEMTRSVVTQLGTPESYVDEEEHTAAEAATEPPVRVRKRFYRDTDNQLLGGVCAGIAAYLGWDAFWVRILVILLTFLWGITIPIYLIVWAIAPAATTAAQRLEMRGEVASVENIKKEIEAAKAYAEEHKVADFFRSAVGVTLKLILGLIVLCVVVPVLFLIAVLCIALFGAGTGLLSSLPVIGGLSLFTGSWWMTSLYVLLSIMVIGIPLFAIIYWVVKYAKQHRHPSAGFWWISIVLWILSFVGFGVLTVFAFQDLGGVRSLQYLTDDDMLVPQTREVAAFHAVDITGCVDLTIRQDSNQMLSVATFDQNSVHTFVNNDTLYIQAVSVGGADVELSAPRLTSLQLRGAADIRTAGVLTGQSLQLTLAGASEADLSLAVDTLIVDAMGASELDLKGQAQYARLRMMGGSDTDAYKLTTRSMDIYCAGASMAEVYCTDTLAAQAYGASSIRYKGNPMVQENIAVGASNIRKK